MEMKMDKFHAKTAFFLSLGFFIPLFNIGFILVSIFLAFKALKLIEKHPKQYSGKGYAITALVISITAIILTIIGFIIYFNS
jgi:uncharacterized membrane protein